jgi:hypothetical protein
MASSLSERHAAALLAALAIAGCGGGADNGGTAASQTSATTATKAPAASTTTTAPAATKTSSKPAKGKKAKPQGAATPKAPANAPPTVKKAVDTARQQQRVMLRLATLCPKAVTRPHLPKDSAAMPRYARAVLPLAKRRSAQLHRAATPAVRRRIAVVASLYRGLVPYLAQLANPGASADEVKLLAKPTSRYVAALHTAAIGAGVPRCGLPV